MTALKTIFSALTGGLVKEVGQILDDTITSKEERLTAQQKLTETLSKLVDDSQQTLTDRHSADMKSDNWLSKSIRPFTLTFTIMMIAFLSFTDGNFGEFTVKPTYIEVLEGWGSLAFAFYFGSKAVERTFSIINTNKINK
jgi:hypothetical protein